MRLRLYEKLDRSWVSGQWSPAQSEEIGDLQLVARDPLQW
jgi:hypothetical protein